VLVNLRYNSEYGKTLEEKANCLELFKEGIKSSSKDLTKDDDLRKGIADYLGRGCKDAFKLLDKNKDVWRWKNFRGDSVLANLCFNSEYGKTLEEKANCLELFKEGIKSSSKDLPKDYDLRKGIADYLGRGCKEALKFLSPKYKDVWQWKNGAGESVLESLCYYSEYGETQEKRANCLELFKEGIDSPQTDLTKDDDLRKGIADSLGDGCKDAFKFLLTRYKDVLNWKDRKGRSVAERLGK
jgi:hypothetical protein